MYVYIYVPVTGVLVRQQWVGCFVLTRKTKYLRMHVSDISQAAVTWVNFSQDHQFMITSSKDCTIRVWDTNSTNNSHMMTYKLTRVAVEWAKGYEPKQTQCIKVPTIPNVCLLAPDDSTLAVIFGNDLNFYRIDGTVLASIPKAFAGTPHIPNTLPYTC